MIVQVVDFNDEWLLSVQIVVLPIEYILLSVSTPYNQPTNAEPNAPLIRRDIRGKPAVGHSSRTYTRMLNSTNNPCIGASQSASALHAPRVR